LATFQTLRLEALDHFDKSLSEGKPGYLEKFLERHLLQEPPPLELLSQVAEDIHQRLLTLRQHHFDLREGVRRTLQQHQIDITPFVPPDPVAYHQLDLEALMSLFSGGTVSLTDESDQALRTMLQEKQAAAARLYSDIMLAEHLYTYLMDWLMALHIVSVRGAWTDMDTEESSLIH